MGIQYKGKEIPVKKRSKEEQEARIRQLLSNIEQKKSNHAHTRNNMNEQLEQQTQNNEQMATLLGEQHPQPQQTDTTQPTFSVFQSLVQQIETNRTK